MGLTTYQLVQDFFYQQYGPIRIQARDTASADARKHKAVL